MSQKKIDTVKVFCQSLKIQTIANVTPYSMEPTGKEFVYPMENGHYFALLLKESHYLTTQQ